MYITLRNFSRSMEDFSRSPLCVCIYVWRYTESSDDIQGDSERTEHFENVVEYWCHPGGGNAYNFQVPKQTWEKLRLALQFGAYDVFA
jgi:hypothetical protein